jgi:hypothetical protein
MVSARKSVPKAIYRTADEIERRIKTREEMRQGCRSAREGSSRAA